MTGGGDDEMLGKTPLLDIRREAELEADTQGLDIFVSATDLSYSTWHPQQLGKYLVPIRPLANIS